MWATIRAEQTNVIYNVQTDTHERILYICQTLTSPADGSASSSALRGHTERNHADTDVN